MKRYKKLNNYRENSSVSLVRSCLIFSCSENSCETLMVSIKGSRFTDALSRLRFGTIRNRNVTLLSNDFNTLQYIGMKFSDLLKFLDSFDKGGVSGMHFFQNSSSR